MQGLQRLSRSRLVATVIFAACGSPLSPQLPVDAAGDADAAAGTDAAVQDSPGLDAAPQDSTAPDAATVTDAASQDSVAPVDVPPDAPPPDAPPPDAPPLDAPPLDAAAADAASDASSPADVPDVAPLADAIVDGAKTSPTDAGPTCNTNADCADNNACTIDTCTASGCTYTPVISACCNSGKASFSATFESGALEPLSFSSPVNDFNWQVVPHKYLDGNYELYAGSLSPLPPASCDPVLIVLDTPVVKLPANSPGLMLGFTLYAGPQAPQLLVILKFGSMMTILWHANDPSNGLLTSQLNAATTIYLLLKPYQGLDAVVEFAFTYEPCSSAAPGIYLDDICIK